jgi:DNA-binding MarR family transcriptional regulator
MTEIQAQQAVQLNKAQADVLIALLTEAADTLSDLAGRIREVLTAIKTNPNGW